MRTLLRVIPTAVVLCLMVLVARAQSDGPARRAAAARAQSVTCTEVPPVQPLPPIGVGESIVAVQRGASCTAVIGATYFVDPGSEPFESSFALYDGQGLTMGYPLDFRSPRTFTASGPIRTHDLERPLVRWMVEGAGDDILDGALAFAVKVPISATAAPYFSAQEQGHGLPLHLSMPGAWFPAPGPNPRLSGQWITVPTATSDWVGFQAIRASEPLPLAGFDAVIQTFPMGVTITASWVELAVHRGFGVTWTAHLDVGEVGAQFDPNFGPISVTLTADLSVERPAERLPAFVASARAISSTAYLHGGRMYAVSIPTNEELELGYDPSPSTALGQLWLRSTQGLGWVPVPGKLGIRVIGVPQSLSPPLAEAPGSQLHRVATPTAMAAIDARVFEQRLPDVGEIDEFSLPMARATPLEPGGGVTYTANLSLRIGGPRGATSTVISDYSPYRLVDDYAEPLPSEVPFGQVTRRTVTTDRLIVTDRLAGLPGVVTITAMFLESSVGAPIVWPTYDPDAALIAGHLTGTAHNEYGIQLPLAGTNPRLAVSLRSPSGVAPELHRVCANLIPMGDETAVVSPTYTAVQRFQVPARCEPQWIELALPPGQSPLAPARVAIVDLTGHPPQGPPPPGAFADVFHTDSQGRAPRAPVWRASAPLVPGQTLEPGREYGLLVECDADWSFGAGVLTPTAGLYRAPRGPVPAPWEPVGQDLGFRLIGRQLPAATSVDPPLSIPALTLRLSPNPMRGSLEVTWTGEGAAEVRIVDVSGRQIRHQIQRSGERAGRWTWDGLDAKGQAVPAGIYFVRVVRGRTETAVERVVLMR